MQHTPAAGSGCTVTRQYLETCWDHCEQVSPAPATCHLINGSMCKACIPSFGKSWSAAARCSIVHLGPDCLIVHHPATMTRTVLYQTMVCRQSLWRCQMSMSQLVPAHIGSNLAWTSSQLSPVLLRLRHVLLTVAVLPCDIRPQVIVMHLASAHCGLYTRHSITSRVGVRSRSAGSRIVP